MIRTQLTGLGPHESRLLTDLERLGISVFSVGKHRHLLDGFANTQLRDVVHGLSTKGWLLKIEAGKYLVVPRAGRGAWHEHPFVIASGIAPAEHYISYWSALSHYGLTSQMPRVVYVALRCSRKQPITFRGWRYQFVCLAERKFFGFRAEEFTALNGAATVEVQVADPEKAILDSLDEEQLAGGMPEVARCLRRGLEAGALSVDVLLDYGQRYGSAALLARLGYLLERLGVERSGELLPLIRRRGEPPCLSTGIPCGDATLDRRWRLRVNLPDSDFFAEGVA